MKVALFLSITKNVLDPITITVVSMLNNLKKQLAFDV
jgi:hypothetical protein